MSFSTHVKEQQGYLLIFTTLKPALGDKKCADMQLSLRSPLALAERLREDLALGASWLRK